MKEEISLQIKAVSKEALTGKASCSHFGQEKIGYSRVVVQHPAGSCWSVLAVLPPKLDRLHPFPWPGSHEQTHTQHQQLLPLPVLSKNKLCRIQPSLSEGSLGPEGAGTWVGLIPLAPSLLPAATRAAFREKGAGSKAQPRACSGGVMPGLRLKLRLILECRFCCASAETGFTEESVQWCNYRLQLPKLPNWPCAHFYSFKGL